MRVFIAGAGVGGLSTALSLDAVGLRDITIAETAPEIRPLGVGINLLPHAVRELSELGLGPELEARGLPVDYMAYYDQYGNHICSTPRGLKAGYRWPQYSLHRGDLQMMLLREVHRRLGSDVVRTGTTVRGFEQWGDHIDVEVTEQRGAQTSASVTHAADVLIAADGINSTVRSLLYPTEGSPRWNQCVMWRGTSRVDNDFLDARTVIFAGHHDQRFMAYPIRNHDGEVILNWIATMRVGGSDLAPEDWNRRVDPEQIIESYRSWTLGPLHVPSVMESNEGVYEYPMTDRDPLPRWSFDRLTLLGDAAHPMYPTGSQGSSQAVLDARVLAKELHSNPDVVTSLKLYEDKRMEATAQVVRSNRQMGDARLLQIVHERAPRGFVDGREVISEAEVREITDRYQVMAGFDPETLNGRPSMASK